MRFTDDPPVGRLYPCHTLQIFSAKIAGIGGFQWPLDVFGLVAIRDSVDQNRNIIFQRSRDDCQTITGKDPYLVLTGPTRAVLLWDPVTIEVYLKVKGPSELEDKTLCFHAEVIQCFTRVNSCLLHRTWTSKFSTLELTLGHINFSVEATISVRVVDGSWQDGFTASLLPVWSVLIVKIKCLLLVVTPVLMTRKLSCLVLEMRSLPWLMV
ncbi:hypothetical protein PVAP13_2NG601040 [Panicum virgatum]|uniref:DUF6598 domain-containing protein n=2 Tax=Panicum virgatum TaxID=38727 RepID=A0A8T0VUK2_PANVG|nr:hypothetical protein PVAP13_2NG601040 [Panicum virgatum]